MELFLIRLFFKLFNISIAASFFIFAVAVFRLVFKKAPKKILCVLWAIVGLRLLLPFTLESKLSLVPTAVDLGVTVVVEETDNNSHVSAQAERSSTDFVSVVEKTTPFREVTEQTENKSPVRFNETYIVIVWLTGVGIMLIYMLASYFRVKRGVGVNVPYDGQNNAFFADNAQTAFILGIIKPKIYLPSGIVENDIPLVLAHENAHVKRFDHIIKPFSFLILSIYWFNPVLWLAYVLLCKDIEAACDERVLSCSNEDSRSDYSKALIRLSTKQKKITACPLAFGETGVKKRVKSIMNYKKPAFWLIITAVLASAVVAVCFFTSPKSDGERLFPVGKRVSAELDAAIHQAIMENEKINNFCTAANEFATDAHVIYGTKKKDRKTTVYMYAEYSEFAFLNDCFVRVSGAMYPCVAEFNKTEKGYELEKLTIPEDGEGYYIASIKEMFPVRYRYRALNRSSRVTDALWGQCVANAQEYLNSVNRNGTIKKYSEIPRVDVEGIFNISEAQSEKIADLMYHYNFAWQFASREYIENGIRYVYLSEYELEKNLIILTKYNYETGKVVDYHEIDVLTATEKTDVVMPENRYAFPKAEYTVSIPQELDSAISKVLLEKARNYRLGELSTEGHEVFGFEDKSTEATVYMYMTLANYCFKNGIFAEISGCGLPVVMSFKKTDDGFELKEYKEPDDGEENRSSINKLFPKELREYALNPPEKMFARAEEQCVKQAQNYLDSIGRNEKVGDYSDFSYVFPDKVFNITAEQVDALSEAVEKYSDFEVSQGYYEEIIDGVRYVFATDYYKNENKITLTKYEYATDKVVEYREIDVNTAKDIKTKAPELYNPSSERYEPKAGEKDELTTIAIEAG